MPRRLIEEARRRKDLLLVLDFDGTLCETVPSADQARLTPPQRGVLKRLSSARRRMFILSGRRLPDLARRVRVDGPVYYGGNFGLEMRGPRWSFLHPATRGFGGKLRTLSRELSGAFRGFPGVLVEWKRWTVSLHYRMLPEGRLRAFQAAVAAFRGRRRSRGLKWVRGDFSWEILPDINWDKGRATRLVWEKLRRPYILAIGNTGLDEDVFRVALDKGAAVRVGNGEPSSASHRLKDVSEVYRFLSQLAR